MLSFRAFPVVLAAVVLTSCGSSGGTEPAPVAGGGGGGGGGTGVSVTVSNNDYSPSQVSVARGTTVTWRWNSCTGDGYGGEVCTSHSVTFDDGGPSAAARTEGSFARTFASAGNFTYYCTSHGRAAMSGSVAVQ
jgi:plastocyanin